MFKGKQKLNLENKNEKNYVGHKTGVKINFETLSPSAEYPLDIQTTVSQTFGFALTRRCY